MKKFILLFSLMTIINNDVKGYCDIKGNVNNPGVYEIKENETINDVIKKAGGLKKNSYTDNINLSKIVSDEMVIYIHSKTEIDKLKELNTCVCSPIIKYIDCDEEIHKISTTSTTKPIVTKEISSTTSTTKPAVTKEIYSTSITTTTSTSTNALNKKININTATLEELIKLNGLGETKANKIIEYRNINGKFESIDELLKVDGIGNKTLESIKDYIEI